MTEHNEKAVSHERTSEEKRHGELEFVLSLTRQKDPTSTLPSGLVVSPDDEVRETLAGSLGECGFAAIFAATVGEGRIALARREVFVVVSEEWLPDGSYVDIVNLTAHSYARIPVVVVSRIGDWPEYLRAVGAGAFDYVPYPPIRGELRRVIRGALTSRHASSQLTMPFEIRPGGQKA
jgi:two-component system response regulator PilR (NtrC family)